MTDEPVAVEQQADHDTDRLEPLVPAEPDLSLTDAVEGAQPDPADAAVLEPSELESALPAAEPERDDAEPDEREADAPEPTAPEPDAPQADGPEAAPGPDTVERDPLAAAPDPTPSEDAEPATATLFPVDEPEEPAWGERELAFLREVLRNGDTMVDVGGGLGHFTLLGALVVGASGHILSVEPDAERCAHLERAAIDSANVRIVRVTAADIDNDAVPEGEAIQRRLDSLLNTQKITALDLLRLDVGGDVLDVLDGAQGIIAASWFHGPVMIHVDAAALEAAGKSTASIDDYFDPDEWADTTGLRLMSSPQSTTRYTRIFERR